jgi:seryl-tRNA synthetase
MAAEIREADAEQQQLLSELIERGMLVESGVPGVYGHSEAFGRVCDALERWLTAAGREAGAEVLRFPPLLPKVQLEKVGYLGNFPHLAGSVFSFEGDESQAAELAAHAAAHEDWSAALRQTDLTLVPAACYPVYPAIAARGPVPDEGVIIDVGPSWVFRHEPSFDPGRRQVFHMHELVHIGPSTTVLSWRNAWAERALALFIELGLNAWLAPASDPFFGRRGRMMAASQRAQELKLELLVSIAGPEPTACASFNHHLDHFSATFGLTLGADQPAHTACLGFGHERIVLALVRQHGYDLDAWPDQVRAILWPDEAR